MTLSLRAAVQSRARNQCEYCCLPEALDLFPFQLEHIIAEKHHGETILENLAWSCFHCNVHKGPNLAGFDAVERKVIRLFHPRADTWSDHFLWDGCILQALTAIGRVTVDVLNINLPERIDLRRLLNRAGVWPAIQPLS